MGLGFFLLIPVVLAPVFIATTPVLPYHASTSLTVPFHFLVLDAVNGHPIAGAHVRRIDVRYPLDDHENQSAEGVTEADGKVEEFLYADVTGRVGLLGRTDNTSYRPWLVEVRAPGYRSFLAPLADEVLPVSGLLPTDPPLGLTFPPPASATIRLAPRP